MIGLITNVALFHQFGWKSPPFTQFHPGALLFKSNERITVLSAIAHAGGLTDRASKRILVKRAARGDGPAEVTVDFNRILAGKEPDVELRQGDVIVVKESFF